MGRLIKFLAWFVAALAALFGIAAVAFYLFFDASDFREEIAVAVTDATGREFAIDGDVSLSIFPWLAVEVGHATLGNAPGFGDEPFAEFDSARLSVRLLPLILRREVSVGTAALDGLRLNLAVDGQGRSNWEDLASEEDAGEDVAAAAADGGSPRGRLDVAGIEVRDAAISYADAGDVVALSGVNIRIGRVAGSAGEVLTVDGVDFEALAEGIAAMPTQLAVSTAGIEVRGSEQSVSIAPVQVEAFGVTARAELEAFSYAGSIEPRAALQIDEFSPRSVMTVFGIEPPETADPGALSSVRIDANAAFTENAVALTDVDIKLDDTSFGGTLSVPRSSDGAFAFDLAADRIDLNRYMAPATEGDAAPAGEAAPVEIPADLIRPLNARGQLRVGSAIVGGLQLDNVELGLDTANGRMRLHPIRADLYGGKYEGDVRIDASGKTPVLSMDENVDGVDLAQLARAMFEQDNITGSIRGRFKLTGRGSDMAAVQRSLSGNIDFELRDGTYEGTDVWYELRRARALLKKEAPPEPTLPARTRFTNVTASGVVTDGVMRNEDFVAELPFMQLTGRGDVNLVAATVNYSLRARVLEKPEALQAATPEEVEDLTKIVIPVKISGPLAAPKVAPDVEDLVRQRVEDEVRKKVEDKLKDLFKR